MSNNDDNKISFLEDIKYNKSDIIRKFVLKYYDMFVMAIIIAVILFLTCIFFNMYKVSKIKAYNQKLFNIVQISDINNYSELKNFYDIKSLRQQTKTLAGLKLASIYKEIEEFSTAKSIYEQIYKNEKDIFFRDLAGLNLLNLYIKDDDSAKKIENLYSSLNNKNNSKNAFMDLVKEQYAVYLLEKEQGEKAKNILESIKNIEDSAIGERIEQYKRIYKIK